jgi:hypothetical protein
MSTNAPAPPPTGTSPATGTTTSTPAAVTTAAAYEVILPTGPLQSVVLPENQDIDKEVAFKAPGVDAAKRSVLTFRIKPEGGKVKLRVALKRPVGDQFLFEQEFEGPPRSWHDVIQPGVLQPENTLILKKTAGPGKITITDMVLLFQASSAITGTSP